MSVSPRRPRPSPPGESIGLALTGGILTFVGTLAFLIWLEYGYTLLLAVPIACLVSLLMLLGRIKQRDYQIYLAMFPPNDPEPDPEPVVKLSPVSVHTNGLGQVIHYSGFALSLTDWQRLARVLIKTEKLTRDNLAAAAVADGTFEHITKAYPIIQKKMIAAGWFTGKGELTEAGRVHFSQFLKPNETPPPVIVPPSPTLPGHFVEAKLQETTTTTTGNRGRK